MYSLMEAMPQGTHLEIYSAWSDEEILLEYRITFQRDAFNELIRRYQRELYSYLRRYLHSAELAEDVFQTTFLQVHLKCDQFEEGRRFRPWLYRIATNQAIDAQRASKRHIASSLNETQSESESSFIDELEHTNGRTPVDLALSDERAARVREAVEKLPELLQQVLNLVYFQGMKYQEAAESLGVPNGTVKSRLNTAMKKLNGLLKDI